MNKVSFLCLVVLLSCNTPKSSTMSSTGSTTNEQGWISLFDGQTLNGWHNYGKTTVGNAWKAENGVLHFDAAARKNGAAGGDIVTNEEFENFHLSLEWRIAPKGNSGIMFYVHEDPARFQNTYNSGPEMQILDNGTPTESGHSDAKLFTHRAGDLYDLLAAKETAKPAGEWNHVEIVANRGKLDFFMNGEHTLTTTMWNDNWKRMIANSKFKEWPGFGTFSKGRIALQDHGDDVWFRNLRIKRL